MTLEELNTLNQSQFIDTLGSIYEHSPWVAEQAYKFKPFDSLQQLQQRMFECVTHADLQLQTQLILNHPELAGKAAERGELTSDSAKEQSSAGLDQCSPEELLQLQTLNAAYQKKFGFPFIVAVKGLTRHAIIDAIKQRTNNTADQEFASCIKEIGKIAHIRLEQLLENTT